MFGQILKDLRGWWGRTQPGFWRRMNSGYRAAVVILILVALWIGSGVLRGGGQSQEARDAATAKPTDVPRVQVMTVNASSRNATLTVRGRTQALHSVDTRAQIDGIVKAI